MPSGSIAVAASGTLPRTRLSAAGDVSATVGGLGAGVDAANDQLRAIAPLAPANPSTAIS
jgi:hypothetical protein